MQFLVAIIAFCFAVYALSHTYQLVRLLGHLAWAERMFGPGGTYLAWRLLGILIILGSFMVIRYPSFFGL